MRKSTHFVLTVSLVALTALQGQSRSAQSSTSIIYHGQLEKEGRAPHGDCTFRFRLWDSASGGHEIGQMQVAKDVPVRDGAFSVPLDFGPVPSDAQGSQWLEVSVRCGTDEDFTLLSGRQSVNTVGNPVPHPDPRPVPSNVWHTSGNSGLVPGVNYLGTADASDLQLRTMGVERMAIKADGGITFGTSENPVNLTVLGGLAVNAGTGGASGAACLAVGLSGEGCVAGVSGHGFTFNQSVGVGVRGTSDGGSGVEGTASTSGKAGVLGITTAQGSPDPDHFIPGGFGVHGVGNAVGGTGVMGEGDLYGVLGQAANGTGVQGESTNGVGVRGSSLEGLAGSFSGNVEITGGDLQVVGTTSTRVLVITGGADLAEPFPVSTEVDVPPGALLVIDEENPGMLKLSDRSYDARVAGVVSGAGGVTPGLTMRQEDSSKSGLQVALTGRVYALATTANGPIKPGDLLTTSSIPGHAMKATDRELSHGALIGKAMSSLEKGSGLVLVLVNLQ